MTMPEMTGSELSKQILKIRPDIPIMLLTGYSELINQKKAKSIGIQSYLTKPVLHRALSNSIRKLLDENQKKA
jgi:CheY-like chemotaxis protein